MPDKYYTSQCSSFGRLTLPLLALEYHSGTVYFGLRREEGCSERINGGFEEISPKNQEYGRIKSLVDLIG